MFYLAVFLLLAAGAAAWSGAREAKKHGTVVMSRRWEASPFYSASAFIEWASSGDPSVRGYARVLAPYDVALLAFLGAGLATLSLAAAEQLQCAAGGRWVLLLAPMAFSAADFTEDRLLLAAIVAARATPEDVRRLRTATLVKFIALGAAVNQALVLTLWAWWA